MTLKLKMSIRPKISSAFDNIFKYAHFYPTYWKFGRACQNFYKTQV